MRYYVGIDGGGTRTTVGLADESGRELLRRIGPPGLIDLRKPVVTGDLLVELVREIMAEAGVRGPAEALCAGLAGAGNLTMRQVVEAALTRTQIARRVRVIPDGEAALYGALGGGAGVLLVGGTGSVAHGRSEDGRVERCGGWGMVLGDEGSAYQIAVSALRAGLQFADGRGQDTRVLDELLHALGFATVDALPSWVAHAEKGEIASLAVHVVRLGEQGDLVAVKIIESAADDLARHVQALLHRLGPWSEPPPVVLHGGVAGDPVFQTYLVRALQTGPLKSRIATRRADAVTGALEYARSL